MKKSLLLWALAFLCGCSLLPRPAPPTPTPTLLPPIPTPTTTPTPPPTPTLAPMVYVVQPGDTLRSIATRFGTTAEAICTYNELPNCNLIYPSQELFIPIPEVIPTETPS